MHALAALAVALAAAWAAGHGAALPWWAVAVLAAGAGMVAAAILRRHPLRDASGWRLAPLAAWILALTALHRLGTVWSEAVPLSSDEAQYWDWSRHLDWGYYSKPPLIAWLIAAWRLVAPDSAAGLRTLALLLAGLGLWGLWLAVRRWAGRTPAWLGVLLAAQLPLTAAGSQLLTTDVVLLTAQAWFLAALAHALPLPGEECPRLPPWLGGLALGLALAAGLLAKFAMAYVAISAVLAILVIPAWRRWLRTPGPWLALTLALAAFLPVLWWNARHDWVSLRHLAGQAGPGGTWQPRWLVEFAAGQVALCLPAALTLIPAAAWAWRERGARPGMLALLAMAAVPLLAILVIATVGKAQANWAAAAWPAATALGACWLIASWRDWPPRRRHLMTRLTIVCGLWCAALQLAIAHPALLHNPAWDLPPRRDPARRLAGWDELGTAVAARMDGTAQSPLLLGGSYHIAAELAFYVAGRPPAHCPNLDGRRMNQYDLWPQPGPSDAGRDALWIDEIDPDQDPAAAVPADLRSAFAAADPPEVHAVMRGGRTWRTFVIWRLRGFRGSLPVLPPRSY